MTTEIVRRPLVPLVLLVFLNLVLLSLQVRDERGQTRLLGWLLWVRAPVSQALQSTTGFVRSAGRRYVLLYGAAKENRQLRSENEKLRVEVAKLRSLQALFTRLPDYDSMRSHYDFQTRLAAVIWKSPPFYSQRIVISAGSRQGVDPGSAVISSRGVVGRVLALNAFTSDVELLTNPGAAAGGMLANSGVQGVVQGDGSGTLRWSFIPSYENVRVGDVVYTSGSDRIYPKGIPIGRVVLSERGRKVYRDVLVEPFVDQLRLEEVLVVTGPVTASPSER